MIPEYNAYKRLFSYIYPVTIERTGSRVNPFLEVVLYRGRLLLNTRNANYAFGDAHRKFKLAFKKTGLDIMPVQSVLILGYGVGCISSIIRNEMHVSCQITGVEIDKKVLDLGEKYFSSAKESNILVHCKDALEYMQESVGGFDVIIVDLFLDAVVPSRFQSVDFIRMLHARLNSTGLVYFNLMTPTYALKQEMEKLKNTFHLFFNEVNSIERADILVGFK